MAANTDFFHNPNEKAHNFYLEARRLRLLEGKDNFIAALDYYERAINSGHAGACFELAQIYHTGYAGMGIEANPQRAREIIEKWGDRIANNNGIGSWNFEGYDHGFFTQKLIRLEEFLDNPLAPLSL